MPQVAIEGTDRNLDKLGAYPPTPVGATGNAGTASRPPTGRLPLFYRVEAKVTTLSPGIA